MMIKIKKQAGLTLIEMMIAMLLGLLVTGSIIAIFISNVKSSSENIKMIHLNQELRTVMGFMSDELKRSGYSGNPATTSFMDDFDTGTANCVLYAYDVDGNGLQATGERFGFKLSPINGKGVIQWGQNRTSKTCTSGIWTALTQAGTADITALTLVPTSVSTANPTINVQKLKIIITGETVLNPGTASRTIEETIRVRNEDAS
jgi:Tfp pilus assembly protein PilW